MNFLDADNLVHLPTYGLAIDNGSFQSLLLDAGFSLTADARCKPNLQVVKMVDDALSCVACIALAAERLCFICQRAHFGPCQL